MKGPSAGVLFIQDTSKVNPKNISDACSRSGQKGLENLLFESKGVVQLLTLYKMDTTVYPYKYQIWISKKLICLDYRFGFLKCLQLQIHQLWLWDLIVGLQFHLLFISVLLKRNNTCHMML